jgi:23S rRNA pseudouridine1911/1915/1917 synthase
MRQTNDNASDHDEEPDGEAVAFLITPDQSGERLDKALAMLMPTVSRSRLKALITHRRVSIGDTVCDDPARKLKPAETVHLVVPEPENAEPQPENIPLVVLHEDDDLVVIDKPAGMVVHPASGHQTGTLVHALLYHCGKSLSGIGGVRRPGIVHRLDKETSGLLVVAKNDAAHQALAAQFADHGRTGPLRREYRAFIWGVPDRRSGTIEASIDRSSSAREKMAIVPPGKGREAITHYTVLERFGHDPRNPVASLVSCQLETGRTHQIRLHMAHIGHPLLADPVYGAGFRTKAVHLSEEAQKSLANLGERQALHAGLLGFNHPRSKEYLEFNSDFPSDLAQLHKALANTRL